MAYESTEELECHGYSGTSTAYKPYNTYNPGTSGSDRTLHVFANQKYLIFSIWYLMGLLATSFLLEIWVTLQARISARL